MHKKDEASRRSRGRLSVSSGELYLLSSLGFFIVMFPFCEPQALTTPLLDIRAWFLHLLKEIQRKGAFLGQNRTSENSGSWRAVQGPRGSLQQQPDPHERLRQQSAVKTVSWGTNQFHGSPRNAGEEEAGGRTGLPRAKWIRTEAPSVWQCKEMWL